MFCYNEKVTGIQHTLTVPWAAMAAVFGSAILALIRPVGLLPISVAFVFSAICATMSWFNWKNYSRPALDPAFSVVK